MPFRIQDINSVIESLKKAPGFNEAYTISMDPVAAPGGEHRIVIRDRSTGQLLPFDLSQYMGSIGPVFGVGSTTLNKQQEIITPAVALRVDLLSNRMEAQGTPAINRLLKAIQSGFESWKQGRTESPIEGFSQTVRGFNKEIEPTAAPRYAGGISQESLQWKMQNVALSILPMNQPKSGEQQFPSPAQQTAAIRFWGEQVAHRTGELGPGMPWEQARNKALYPGVEGTVLVPRAERIVSTQIVANQATATQYLLHGGLAGMGKESVSRNPVFEAVPYRTTVTNGQVRRELIQPQENLGQNPLFALATVAQGGAEPVSGMRENVMFAPTPIAGGGYWFTPPESYIKQIEGYGRKASMVSAPFPIKNLADLVGGEAATARFKPSGITGREVYAEDRAIFAGTFEMGGNKFPVQIPKGNTPFFVNQIGIRIPMYMDPKTGEPAAGPEQGIPTTGLQAQLQAQNPLLQIERGGISNVVAFATGIGTYPTRVRGGDQKDLGVPAGMPLNVGGQPIIRMTAEAKGIDVMGKSFFEARDWGQQVQLIRRWSSKVGTPEAAGLANYFEGAYNPQPGAASRVDLEDLANRWRGANPAFQGAGSEFAADVFNKVIRQATPTENQYNQANLGAFTTEADINLGITPISESNYTVLEESQIQALQSTPGGSKLSHDEARAEVNKWMWRGANPNKGLPLLYQRIPKGTVIANVMSPRIANMNPSYEGKGVGLLIRQALTQQNEAFATGTHVAIGQNEATGPMGKAIQNIGSFLSVQQSLQSQKMTLEGMPINFNAITGSRGKEVIAKLTNLVNLRKTMTEQQFVEQAGVAMGDQSGTLNYFDVGGVKAFLPSLTDVSRFNVEEYGEDIGSINKKVIKSLRNIVSASGPVGNNALPPEIAGAAAIEPLFSEFSDMIKGPSRKTMLSAGTAMSMQGSGGLWLDVENQQVMASQRRAIGRSMGIKGPRNLKAMEQMFETAGAPVAIVRHPLLTLTGGVTWGRGTGESQARLDLGEERLRNIKRDPNQRLNVFTGLSPYVKGWGDIDGDYLQSIFGLSLDEKGSLIPIETAMTKIIKDPQRAAMAVIQAAKDPYTSAAQYRKEDAFIQSGILSDVGVPFDPLAKAYSKPSIVSAGDVAMRSEELWKAKTLMGVVYNSQARGMLGAYANALESADVAPSINTAMAKYGPALNRYKLGASQAGMAFTTMMNSAYYSLAEKGEAQLTLSTGMYRPFQSTNAQGEKVTVPYNQGIKLTGTPGDFYGAKFRDVMSQIATYATTPITERGGETYYTNSPNDIVNAIALPEHRGQLLAQLNATTPENYNTIAQSYVQNTLLPTKLWNDRSPAGIVSREKYIQRLWTDVGGLVNVAASANRRANKGGIEGGNASRSVFEGLLGPAATEKAKVTSTMQEMLHLGIPSSQDVRAADAYATARGKPNIVTRTAAFIRDIFGLAPAVQGTTETLLNPNPDIGNIHYESLEETAARRERYKGDVIRQTFSSASDVPVPATKRTSHELGFDSGAWTKKHGVQSLENILMSQGQPPIPSKEAQRQEIASKIAEVKAKMASGVGGAPPPPIIPPTSTGDAAVNWQPGSPEYNQVMGTVNAVRSGDWREIRTGDMQKTAYWQRVFPEERTAWKTMSGMIPGSGGGGGSRRGGRPGFDESGYGYTATGNPPAFGQRIAMTLAAFQAAARMDRTRPELEAAWNQQLDIAGVEAAPDLEQRIAKIYGTPAMDKIMASNLGKQTKQYAADIKTAGGAFWGRGTQYDTEASALAERMGGPQEFAWAGVGKVPKAGALFTRRETAATNTLERLSSQRSEIVGAATETGSAAVEALSKYEEAIKRVTEAAAKGTTTETELSKAREVAVKNLKDVIGAPAEAVGAIDIKQATITAAQGANRAGIATQEQNMMLDALAGGAGGGGGGGRGGLAGAAYNFAGVARRMLSGWGLMYGRSVIGLATEGVGWGAAEASQLQATQQQILGQQVGAGAVYATPIQRAQLAVGLAGGGVPFNQQIQTLAATRPAARDIGQGIIAGASVAGATAWAASMGAFGPTMAAPGAIAPFMGPIALAAGVIATGLSAYTLAQDPNAVANRMNLSGINEPGIAGWLKPIVKDPGVMIAYKLQTSEQTRVTDNQRQLTKLIGMGAPPKALLAAGPWSATDVGGSLSTYYQQQGWIPNTQAAAQAAGFVTNYAQMPGINAYDKGAITTLGAYAAYGVDLQSIYAQAMSAYGGGGAQITGVNAQGQVAPTATSAPALVWASAAARTQINTPQGQALQTGAQRLANLSMAGFMTAPTGGAIIANQVLGANQGTRIQTQQEAINQQLNQAQALTSAQYQALQIQSNNWMQMRGIGMNITQPTMAGAAAINATPQQLALMQAQSATIGQITGGLAGGNAPIWGAIAQGGINLAGQAPLQTTFGRTIGAEYAAFTGMNMQGQLTGGTWGRESMAMPGFTRAQMAERVWGERVFGAGAGANTGMAAIYRNAAINGVPLAATGELVGGWYGMQQQQLNTQYANQMAGVGVQMAGIQLNKAFTTGVGIGNYNPTNPQTGQPFGFNTGKFGFNIPGIGAYQSQGGGQWGLADAGRYLGYAQQEYGFGMQQRQLNLQTSQFYESMGLQAQGMALGRAQGTQQFQYAQGISAQQFGFGQTMFREQARFLSGRERRLAEMQNKENVTVYGMEKEQREKEFGFQKQQWKLQTEQYNLQIKQFEQTKQLQQEQLTTSIKFYQEQKKLQEQAILLDRAYWVEQIKLQEASAAIQAKSIKDQKTMNDYDLAYQKFMEDQNNLLGNLNANSFPNLIKNLQDKVPAAFQIMINKMLLAVGAPKGIVINPDDANKPIAPGMPPDTSGNWVWNGKQWVAKTTGKALGGMIYPGQSAIVGDNPFQARTGYEELISALPGGGAMISSNAQMNRAMGTIISRAGMNGKTIAQPINVYLGNEKLASYVVDIVAKDLAN